MYKYFSSSTDPKIQCQCGCGLNLSDMDIEFMVRVERAREKAGVPFIINSGIRCPLHNNRVSNTGFNGPHTTGKALDIATPNSNSRFIIRRELIKEGFHRFGSHPSFIHVDDSPDHPPEVEWWY